MNTRSNNSIKLHEKKTIKILNFIEAHKTSWYKPSKIYEIQYPLVI